MIGMSLVRASVFNRAISAQPSSPASLIPVVMICGRIDWTFAKAVRGLVNTDAPRTSSYA
jgi:hypothetical protein